MFEDLFGSKIVEKICFYMISNQKCYASLISESLRKDGIQTYKPPQ
jgi:hypothetical protein